jgi:hypothetical protein
MEVLLHYAVLIASAIWLTRMITRIAVATETTAIHTARRLIWTSYCF